MKSWFALLLLIPAFANASEPEARLLVLPSWTDPTCPALRSFSMGTKPEYSVIEGIEQEALMAMYNLDTCRQTSCLLPAAQSGKFSYLLLVRQLKKEAECSARAELVEASSFKLLKMWEPLDTAGAWVQAADSILRKTVLSNKVGQLDILTQPAGAQVIGLPTNPGPTPVSKWSLAVGDYPIRVAMNTFDTILDTIRIEAGKVSERLYTLKHTKAYTDSLIVANAEQSPETRLQALFQRILKITIEGEPTIAVEPFSCDIDSATLRKLGYNPGIMAAEYGIIEVRNDQRFQLVDRKNAHYLITGNAVIANGQQRYYLRLVDTKSGEIVSAAMAYTRSNQNEELFRKVGEHATSTGATFRSLVAPGWGQFYTGHPSHGYVFAVLAVASVGYLSYRILDFQDKQDEYSLYDKRATSTLVAGETEKDWADRANRVRKDRNSAATQLNIALGLTGITWVLNLVDSYWLGEASAKAIRPSYFVVAPMVMPGQVSLNAALSF